MGYKFVVGLFLSETEENKKNIDKTIKLYKEFAKLDLVQQIDFMKNFNNIYFDIEKFRIFSLPDGSLEDIDFKNYLSGKISIDNLYWFNFNTELSDFNIRLGIDGRLNSLSIDNLTSGLLPLFYKDKLILGNLGEYSYDLVCISDSSQSLCRQASFTVNVLTGAFSISYANNLADKGFDRRCINDLVFNLSKTEVEDSLLVPSMESNKDNAFNRIGNAVLMLLGKDTRDKQYIIPNGITGVSIYLPLPVEFNIVFPPSLINVNLFSRLLFSAEFYCLENITFVFSKSTPSSLFYAIGIKYAKLYGEKDFSNKLTQAELVDKLIKKGMKIEMY